MWVQRRKYTQYRQMTEQTIATFRIEKQKWVNFQELAKTGETNASRLIIGFIEACTDSRIDIADYAVTKPRSIDTSTDSIDSYLDKHLDIRIDSYLEKLTPPQSVDIETVRSEIEQALEPIRESISRLVEMPQSIAKKQNTPKQSRDDEPDWVTKDNRRFYLKLVGDPILLDKVNVLIESVIGNAELANELVTVGICQEGGKPLHKGSVSHVKAVVKHLKMVSEGEN